MQFRFSGLYCINTESASQPVAIFTYVFKADSLQTSPTCLRVFSNLRVDYSIKPSRLSKEELQLNTSLNLLSYSSIAASSNSSINTAHDLDFCRYSEHLSLLNMVGTGDSPSCKGSMILHRISYSLSDIHTFSLVSSSSHRSDLDTN